MKKRIFITGAKGFLGTALWRFIEERGLPFELFGFSRHKKHASKKMITGELNNQKDLCRVLSLIRPDYIFHFAGGRVPQEDKMFESNFMTSKILFESIKMMPHYQPRIVIPGTAAEYGRVAWKKKVDEAMPTKPISWYGFVKCMQTELSLLYARRGLNITIARMFNVLGAGAPPVLAIGKFAQDIVMIEKDIKPPIIQTKDLSGRRDFLDIEDVCAALLLVGQHGKTGEIYNICAGQCYLMRGLLRQLIKYSKVKNIQIEEDCRNASDSYDVTGSNRKIMNTMGWKPRVSIEKSLNDTLNYYRTLYKTKP